MNRQIHLVMRAGADALNIISSQLAGRKLVTANQRERWAARAEAWQREIDGCAEDAYYAALDQTLVATLTGLTDVKLLLEVGCFFGWRLAQVAQALPQAAVIGADLVLEGLRVAKTTGRMACLVNADATRLPFHSNAVDCVYTVACLTHIPERAVKRALDEMQRVTRRYLVLIEIYDRLMRFPERLRTWAWRDGFCHAYERLLTREGLRRIRMEGLCDADGHPRLTLFVYAKTSERA